MDTFEGFTEEDIKRLSTEKNQISETKQNAAAVSKNIRRHQNRLLKKNVIRERMLKGNYNSTHAAGIELPKEARLHIPQIPEEEEEDEDHHEETKEKNIPNTVSVDLVLSNDSAMEKPSKTSSECGKEDEIKTSLPGKLTQTVLHSDADENTLEEFEARQKLMKEQNRQRKEILQKALADRAKKTHEETKRLNEIEGELKKLDLLLSNDVAILRNQIESASLDFMEAQKRYDKAEKEFLDSKLDLFNKKERKELLTSHLCTIIEQNEMRKAKKLSDLMLKLEIGSKSSLMTSQIKLENIEKAESGKSETSSKTTSDKKAAEENS